MADGAAIPLGLVGDIDGTSARFALAAVTNGRPDLIGLEVYRRRDFPSVEEAAQAYLAARPSAVHPFAAVLTTRGAIVDGEASFAEANWSISERAFCDKVALRSTRLIDDRVALALAAPTLSAQEAVPLGPDLDVVPRQTVAILGAAGGLEVSVLAHENGHEATMATQGGHVAFAPLDALEIEVWRRLSRQFGRVSIDRIVSGPGLLNLHTALGDAEGLSADSGAAGEVIARAEAGDPRAQRTIDSFCAILGSVAGDLALAYGARGGVFVAGLLTGGLTGRLQASAFRERFEAKGRFRDYTRAIPTRLIVDVRTAVLLGAARALTNGLEP
jgi:glucokinase